jgi:lipopolysaccharide/colanic/teichoic acid biosynthesis glycosyltransferase
MDLLFQPQTLGKAKRISAPLTFRTTYFMPLAGEFQYSGLCYIGKNTSHIARLIRIYNKAYAADKLEHAKNELLRRVEAVSNEIPEIIICEAGFGLDAIRKFLHFIHQHPVLNSIPFVLEGSTLQEKELSLCRKSVRVDEILFLDQCEDRHLKQKFHFLRKVKAKAAVAAALVEENVRSRRVSAPPTKRAFDILMSSIGLLVLSPLFLLIAVAIKLESGGPVFYISKRAGRGYRIFNFYKFRTMYRNADQKIAALKHLNQYNSTTTSGPVFFKINNDPRITRVGKFLRNTSLDELPQLLNVFLGDMSLVGNRPLPLYEAATLTTDDYAVRFMAPAGITGLWQIKKRGNKDMSVEERINIDIDYAAKHSFATDFWIIANTPSALLQKENV